MRRWLTILLLLTLPVGAMAQGPTSVQPVGQKPDACGQLINHATGAGNTSVVATLTPLSGQSIYLCTIELSETANAAVTGATGVNTTIVVAGCNASFTFYGDNSSLTVGQTKDFFHSYTIPMKCNPSTAVTATWSSAGQSTQNVRVTLTGYSALP